LEYVGPKLNAHIAQVRQGKNLTGFVMKVILLTTVQSVKLKPESVSLAGEEAAPESVGAIGQDGVVAAGEHRQVPALPSRR
jgi:hypothetical protein